MPRDIHSNWMRKLRMGTTISAMGWKTSTAIAQTLGFLDNIDVLLRNGDNGLKHAAAAITEVGRQLRPGMNQREVSQNLHEFIHERSTFMVFRRKNFNRDVRDALRTVGPASLAADAQTSFFYLTGIMDEWVSTAGWISGYRQAMAGDVENVDLGDERAAIDYADSVVRESQGAGAVKDLAAVQRAGELNKLWTMFYSYFSVLYNRTSESGRDARLGGLGAGGRVIAHAFLAYFLPSALQDILTLRAPFGEDDEEWLKWFAEKQVSGLFAPIPLARDVADSLASGFDMNSAPLDSWVNSVANGARGVGKLIEGGPGEVSEFEYRQMALAVSVGSALTPLGGLPGPALWDAGAAMWHMANGDDFWITDPFLRRPPRFRD